MILKKKTLVYLAAPYSATFADGDAAVAIRKSRFEAINAAASFLMQEGLHIFSPISHSHPIALAGGLPTGWEFWSTYDETMLSMCGAFCVLRLDGWEQSVGVLNECTIARRIGLRIHYTLPDLETLKRVTRELRHAIDVKFSRELAAR